MHTFSVLVFTFANNILIINMRKTKKRVTAATKLQALARGNHTRSKQKQQNTKRTDDNEDQHHQVYCLPLAMSALEWEHSSETDRSFVLVFNMALCYHLWGMDVVAAAAASFLSTPGAGFFTSYSSMMMEPPSPPPPHQQQSPQPQQQLFAQQLFHEAKKLYLLVGGHDGDVYVVDKFCYPAIFNNLSHVCKSLEGYHSYEAYRYDTLLLKSVRLLIEAAAPTAAPSAATTAGAAAFTYYERDTAIIHSFLESVFYLHGVSENTVPAHAA